MLSYLKGIYNEIIVQCDHVEIILGHLLRNLLIFINFTINFLH